jgi:hypothetical protein
MSRALRLGCVGRTIWASSGWSVAIRGRRAESLKGPSGLRPLVWGREDHGLVQWNAFLGAATRIVGTEATTRTASTNVSFVFNDWGISPHLPRMVAEQAFLLRQSFGDTIPCVRLPDFQWCAV